MNKVIPIVAVLVLVGAGLWYVSSQPATQESMMKDDSMMEDESMKKEDDSMMMDDDGVMMEGKEGDGMMMEEGVKVFEIDAMNFSFSVPEIRVKEGDTVKIRLTAKEGFHDWTIDEFNARTEQIAEGSSSEVEFVADQAGTFEYYCSVGNHRQLGMVGTLIVE